MDSPSPSFPDPESERARRGHRRRAVVVAAALALLLHGLFLGGAGWPSIGRNVDPENAAPMQVRAVPADAEEPAVAAESAAEPPAAPPAVARKPRLRGPRAVSGQASAVAAATPAQPIGEAQGRATEAPLAEAPPVDPQASAASVAAEASDAAAASSMPADPTAVSATASAAASAAVAVSASTAAAVAEAAAEGAPAASTASAAPPAQAASGSFLSAGELPPPTYRTLLPAAVTLRYEVRRGFFRGTGEIRWHPAESGYELRLDARLAGITLLSQTSQGDLDATGLAPRRFVDQRARRAAQAANFNRESGTITFSGASSRWPLLGGTQDRLSWLIQLAGIVAAEPALAAEGGKVVMVIVGARGDAAIWTLRYDGRENVETSSGSVHAVKFVRDARHVNDTSAEIWLDPDHGFLPAHATQRDGSGSSEYDLLLERIEPGP